MKKHLSNKKKLMFIMIIIFVSFFIVKGTSYGFYSNSYIKMVFGLTEKSSSITYLNQTSPIYVAKGMKFAPEVKLTNITVGQKVLTWVSSDPSIAIVDQYGVVTGISDGSCEITVSTEDGQKVTKQIEVTELGLYLKDSGTSQDTLLLNQEGIYGSPINMTSDSKLYFNQSNVNITGEYIVSGIISGIFNLVIDGCPYNYLKDNRYLDKYALVIDGDNTYSGTTTINNMVQVGNNDTTGRLGNGDITNNGMLKYNRSDDTTISNNILGTGNLIQNGTGLLTLTGTNTYTGKTILDSSLQIGTDALPSSTGTGSITNNGSLILNNLESKIFSNNISGSGSVTIDSNPITVPIEYLIVAGGGAGGGYGAYQWEGQGGGGAGGLIYNISGTLNAGQTTLTVGDGGLQNANGKDSILGTEIAKGGGVGANWQPGGNGGSGGGGRRSGNGGIGVVGQGNDGGSNHTSNHSYGGGGGGAGSPGEIGESGGVGGIGKNINITGTDVMYATGGNGGRGWYDNNNGADAMANTGNGGDGGGGGNGSTAPAGGNGGSGVVVIAYEDSYPELAITGNLTYTVNTKSRPGYYVYSFTSGSGDVYIPNIRIQSSNTYSGDTTINSGIVVADNENSFGTGNVIINSGGTLLLNGLQIPNNIVNNGGTLIP